VNLASIPCVEVVTLALPKFFTFKVPNSLLMRFHESHWPMSHKKLLFTLSTYPIDVDLTNHVLGQSGMNHPYDPVNYDNEHRIQAVIWLRDKEIRLGSMNIQILEHPHLGTRTFPLFSFFKISRENSKSIPHSWSSDHLYSICMRKFCLLWRSFCTFTSIIMVSPFTKNVILFSKCSFPNPNFSH